MKCQHGYYGILEKPMWLRWDPWEANMPHPPRLIQLWRRKCIDGGAHYLFHQDPKFRNLWNPSGWCQEIENALSYSARILVSSSAPQPRV